MAINFMDLLGALGGQQQGGGDPLAALLGARNAAPQGDPQMPAAPIEPQGEDITVQSREPRTGMFGIKGTFRDILGLLGDSLSSATGGDTYYNKRREQEKYADALGEDVMDNPANSVDRLITAGFGKEAGSLAQQVQENEIAKAKAEQYKAYQQAQVTEQGYKNLGSLFATADEKTFPALRAIAERRAASYGIDPGELPNDFNSAKRWGLDPYRRNRLDQFDEKEDNDNRWEEVKERGRMARDNPPASKSRGATQVDAEILDKIRRGTATPAEQQIYKDRLTRAPSRSRSDRKRSGSTSTQTNGSSQKGWTVKRID